MAVFALTDAAFYTACGTAIAAVIPAALAYRRARRVDDKTSDLDTLRVIVAEMRAEKSDHSARLNQLSARLDECEKDKDTLNNRIFELHLEVYKLKAAGG